MNLYKSNTPQDKEYFMQYVFVDQGKKNSS